MNEGDKGRLRFAILGVGSIADFHHQAILDNAHLGAELVAVGHHDPDSAGDRGGRFGVPCLSSEEVLERDDVDVVCICTPSGQHAVQVLEAARAGKHALVEKPLAMTPGDADTMISACERAGVKLGVALQRRAEMPFRQVREAVEAGDLGDIMLGSVTVPYYRPQEYYDQASWRGTVDLDGGALMNQGIHLVDLLLWYMGDPVSVAATASTLGHDMEAEDVVGATLRFVSGAVATVTATTVAAPGFPHVIEVYGKEGGIQVEGETVRRWELTDRSARTVARPKTGKENAAGAGVDPRGISGEGHAEIYRDFINAVREDRPPLVNGREGRRSLAVVSKIYASAGQRRASSAVGGLNV